MFATRRGTVRRNKLSDFTQINKNGKIAMKLDEGDGIVGVFTCTENDDVMLTTAMGQCIRFAATDVRVFAGRNSVGVRGISLAEGDEVISMSVLTHFDCTAEERATYLRWRRMMRGEGDEAAETGIEDDAAGEGELTQERYALMSAHEQVILTLSKNGYGKRSSSFEYRVTGRGGKGITAMAVNKRNGPLVASFPVEVNDQIMLVTNGGQLIRCPVDGIRVAGRATQGVIVFNTAEGEEVVSVSRVSEDDADNGADDAETGEATTSPDDAADPSVPDEGGDS
jgi:DNA gyrase subunit A